MSRPYHLPPRCPLQSRSLSTHAIDSEFQTAQQDDESPAQLHRFPSQGSLLEEQPVWLDDLLSDMETSQKGTSLRRSVSDSVAILEASAAYHSLMFPINEGVAVSTTALGKSSEPTSENESVFEANCVYGPNSPRQKSRLTNSETSMVTALMENVPQNPLQYLSVNFHNAFSTNEPDASKDVNGHVGDVDPEKASRRRAGQRSRVRKLQYIAELERTVDDFQNLGAELAARVASLFQQRVVLSIENKKLKQQMAIFRQEKMIKDGQYKSLKNEVEKLKMIYGRHRKTRSAASCYEMGYEEVDHSGTSWQMLDMGKLSLDGSPVPLNNGIGR